MYWAGGLALWIHFGAPRVRCGRTNFVRGGSLAGRPPVCCTFGPVVGGGCGAPHMLPPRTGPALNEPWQEPVAPWQPGANSNGWVWMHAGRHIERGVHRFLGWGPLEFDSAHAHAATLLHSAGCSGAASLGLRKHQTHARIRARTGATGLEPHHHLCRPAPRPSLALAWSNFLLNPPPLPKV
jgi:hypothetical protein